jgi:hypothetical protein
MNENDLRDCFAMFKAATGTSAEECYRFADEMLEARKAKKEVVKETGIAAVKIKRRSKNGYTTAN